MGHSKWQIKQNRVQKKSDVMLAKYQAMYPPKTEEEIKAQRAYYDAKHRKAAAERAEARAKTPRRYRRSEGLRFWDGGQPMPRPKAWCAACRKRWAESNTCPHCGGATTQLSLRAHVPRLHAGRARWKDFYKRFPSTRPLDPSTGKPVSLEKAMALL